MIRVYAALAALGLILGLGWYAHHRIYAHGYSAGQSAMQASVAQAQSAAAKETTRRDSASAAAGVDMLTYLQHQLPPAEAQTNETIERVRTIYRDRPLSAQCVRPDGVQAALDAARDRANAAAR